jgi:hypothetical protein
MTKHIFVVEDKEAHRSSACSFKNRTMSPLARIEFEAIDRNLELLSCEALLDFRAAEFCGNARLGPSAQPVAFPLDCGSAFDRWSWLTPINFPRPKCIAPACTQPPPL